MQEVKTLQGPALVDKAILIATQGHQGQRDKAGEPYILHPLRVMLNVMSPGMDSYHAHAAAVLHDIIEDTDVTLDRLEGEGMPPEVIRAVDYLTQREGEHYHTYIKRLSQDPLAIWVKIADISDNTRPERLMVLDDRTKERLTAKYIWALDYLYREQVKANTQPIQS